MLLIEWHNADFPSYIISVYVVYADLLYILQISDIKADSRKHRDNNDPYLMSLCLTSSAVQVLLTLNATENLLRLSRHHQIASSYWRTSLAKISLWSHHLYIKSLSWKSISRHITASFALSHHCDVGDNDNLPSGKVQIIDVMHESGSKDVTCWYNIWYPALSFQENLLWWDQESRYS